MFDARPLQCVDGTLNGANIARLPRHTGMWYTFETALDGAISLSLDGSRFDTVLSILEEDENGDPACISTVDDSALSTNSYIGNVPLVAGKYWLAIGGANLCRCSTV